MYIRFLFPVSMSDVAASHSRIIPAVIAPSDNKVKDKTSTSFRFQKYMMLLLVRFSFCGYRVDQKV